jgi:hypothetical protein
MADLKPPFRAEDMEGLYKKVVKGVYQKLPGHYSVDLNEFIAHMLRVSPKSRYSAGELLSLPSVLEKIKSGVNLKETIEEHKSLLLQTIKFPNNLQYLTDKLPKPNYEPMKMANLSDFQGYSSQGNRHHNASDESMLGVRNRSAASKANNRSMIHDTSSGQLPSISPAPQSRKNKRKISPRLESGRQAAAVHGHVHGGGGGGGNEGLMKDRINKQHERVEQQIKKYDEILKRHKYLHQHNQNEGGLAHRKANKVGGGAVAGNNYHRRFDVSVLEGRHNNSSIIDGSVLDSGRKDAKMLGVMGVRLERPRREREKDKEHDGSVIAEGSLPLLSNKYTKAVQSKHHAGGGGGHASSLPKPSGHPLLKQSRVPHHASIL